MTLDELIYLASEFAGDGAVGVGAGFQAYLEMLMRTWNALKAVDPLPIPGARPIDYPTSLSLPIRASDVTAAIAAAPAAAPVAAIQPAPIAAA